MPIDRSIFFDRVRQKPFGGSLSQPQVDGQNAILDEWERNYEPNNSDLRWLAYPLATTYHETSQTMQPIEEYGKGSGQPYGKPDPETGQTYYGRGFVQLTWRENYARADKELRLRGARSCEWHAENALKLAIASDVMFLGMAEGWFRSDSKGAQTLLRYFNATTNDAFNAREIINGDRNTVPSWSNGVSIGNLIKGYHQSFMDALVEAYYENVLPPAPDEVEAIVTINVTVDAPPGVRVAIVVNTPET